MAKITVIGAAGRMGRHLVTTILSTPGMSLAGAVEHPASEFLDRDAAVVAGLPACGVKITASLEEALKIYDSSEWGRNLRPEFRERKMVAASLAKIRKEGGYHSVSGLQGIFAVPVFANGVYLAALGCSMPVSRYTPEHIEEVKRLIGNTAEELSSALSVANSIG